MAGAILVSMLFALAIVCAILFLWIGVMIIVRSGNTYGAGQPRPPEQQAPRV